MKKVSLLASAGVLALTAVWAVNGEAQARDVDWSSIPVQDIELFYPGQSSWEWLTSAAHRAGAQATLEGRSCMECHADEEADMGQNAMSGPLEPAPLNPEKPASITLSFQAAYDAENLYIQASWPAANQGQYHDYIVYQDGVWENYGSHRSIGGVRDGSQQEIYEDRFSIRVGNEDTMPTF